MSKSEFKRLLIQRGRLPMISTGKTNDLKGHQVTMWTEHNVKCPHHPAHIISRSSRRWYCYDCGIYWDDYEYIDD